MPKRSGPPSQTWRAFLTNHVQDLVSIDFFAVPTVRLRVLFVLVVLAHHRRRILHFNVTEHPRAEWPAQQNRGRLPGRHDTGLSPPRSGLGLRRFISATSEGPAECLDHVVALSESHLRRILVRYLAYCHRARTHLSLDKEAPDPRPI